MGVEVMMSKEEEIEKYNQMMRRREEAMKKALQHEQSFNDKPEDLIEKRMGSDLFKGGQWK
jgi:hypothetical protein